MSSATVASLPMSNWPATSNIHQQVVYTTQTEVLASTASVLDHTAPAAQYVTYSNELPSQKVVDGLMYQHFAVASGVPTTRSVNQVELSSPPASTDAINNIPQESIQTTQTIPEQKCSQAKGQSNSNGNHLYQKKLFLV